MTEPRGWHLVFVAALAVAAVGLIAGVERSGRVVVPVRGTVSTEQTPVEARSYRDLRERSYGPNATLSPSWWAGLRMLGAREPARAATPAERTAALAERDARRAYEGAPPTIPHAIDQLAVPACLACHERGVTIAGRRAPPMSHDVQASCVQCHVVATDPRSALAVVTVPASTFVGLRRAGGGAQAWAGAPPVVPHPTWMRERCESCHGPGGRQGLRTPHPAQSSCQQCHAPSAAFDQRAVRPSGGAP